MVKECIITWDIGTKKKTYDLLNQDYLNRVGVKDKSKIKEVRPFFAFHEHPYTEEEVASEYHPCIGSGGAEIETVDGKTATIEEIFYYDNGHKSGELKDIKHYNKEGRFTDINGSTKRTAEVEDHVIREPTDYIDISLSTPSGGTATQRISGW